MRRHPVVARLWEEIAETVAALGFSLVQMTFGGPRGRAALTVYVDKPGGVTVDDCALTAEHLSVLLDSLDPLPDSYDLIVSSPGLDRPLGREEDFATYAGHEVLVRYESASGKARRTRGTLKGLREDAICLQAEGGEEFCLPLGQVTSANLVYNWDQPEA